MKRKVDVFLEKAQERKQVQVELRVEGGRKRFKFVGKPQNNSHKKTKMERRQRSMWRWPKNLSGRRPVTKKPATGMSEDDQIETETGQKMWQAEKVTALKRTWS